MLASVLPRLGGAVLLAALLASLPADADAFGRRHRMPCVPCYPAYPLLLQPCEPPQPQPDPQPDPQPKPDPQPTVKVRQNVATLSEAQLATLRRGVAAMKALPATDPRSWQFQANIHGMTGPSTNPLFKQCEHGTLQFLTWHRAYLYYFERILREQSGDPAFTLPYWNWTSQPTVPEPFRQPANAANPLFDGTRILNNGAAIPASIVVDDLNAALKEKAFPPAGPVPGFSAGLEGSPHGAVHVTVGGNMSQVPLSANDPIFWLHHCNIDRTWDRWLNQGDGRANPADTAFLDKTYSFADETGQTVTRKVRDIISDAKLGYRYDDTPPPPASTANFALVQAAPSPEKAKMMRVATTQAENAPAGKPRRLALDPVTEKLAVPAQHREMVRSAAQAPAGGAKKVLLQIEGLTADQVPEYAYGVYLNLPADDAPPAVAQTHYVGSINFFGKVQGDDHGHDGKKSFTATLDATETVARLAGAKLWNEGELRVTLKPLLPIAPTGQEAGLRQRLQASAERARISYDQVHLVVAP